MTLTYGKGRAGDVDHERAAVLTYSDIQKFLKLLRRHGYPVRYFIAGEYGSKKGRAHWHAILYWQDKKPDVLKRENMMYEHWPHGWSFWDEVSPATVLYCAKYVQADKTDDARQGMIRMSKKPPLGTEYFQGLAEKHVQQGIAPQALDYTFPGVMWSDKGRKVPWRFRLKDRPAELMMDYFIARWGAVHGARHIPASEPIELYQDRLAKEFVADAVAEMKWKAKQQHHARNPIIRMGPQDPWDWEQSFRKRFPDLTQDELAQQWNMFHQYWGE